MSLSDDVKKSIGHLYAKLFLLDHKLKKIYLPHRQYTPTDKDFDCLQTLRDEGYCLGFDRYHYETCDNNNYFWPQLTVQEQYALGLFVEESGEVNQLIGKTLRFGLDIPKSYDSKDEPDLSTTPRERLNAEVGDVFAAIVVMICAGILDPDKVIEARDAKLKTLETGKTKQGQRLSPAELWPVEPEKPSKPLWKTWLTWFHRKGS